MANRGFRMLEMTPDAYSNGREMWTVRGSPGLDGWPPAKRARIARLAEAFVEKQGQKR